MNLEKNRTLPFSCLLNKLLYYLKEKSYNHLTLDNYRRTLRKIETFMVEIGIDVYTPQVGTQYCKNYLMDHDLGTPRQKAMLTAVRRLNDFYSNLNYHIQNKLELRLLPEHYEQPLGIFTRECAESGNKAVTIKSKERFIRIFLRKCIDFGCPDILSLNPAYVTRSVLAIENKDGLTVNRAFLKFLSVKGITEFDLSTLIPSYRRPINIPVTYSEEEVRDFEGAIDRTSDIGKRDFAMLLLVTRLGMRSGDIAKLSLKELDFKNHSICITQQKSGDPLHLPMLADVREALTDYINNARPRVASNTIFLRHNAPHFGISTSVLRFVTTKYFGLAGIDISEKKHGPHTFRSSLASSMVNDDVPYEAVRAILGHSAPNAIKHYAKLDIEKLRECAIEVPKPSGTFKAFLAGGEKS
jgi:site-specific recombinase XerD